MCAGPVPGRCASLGLDVRARCRPRAQVSGRFPEPAVVSPLPANAQLLLAEVRAGGLGMMATRRGDPPEKEPASGAAAEASKCVGGAVACPGLHWVALLGGGCGCPLCSPCLLGGCPLALGVCNKPCCSSIVVDTGDLLREMWHPPAAMGRLGEGRQHQHTDTPPPPHPPRAFWVCWEGCWGGFGLNQPFFT